MVKLESVSVKRQTLCALIPYVNMWAFYRIKKLGNAFLISLIIGFASYPIHHLILNDLSISSMTNYFELYSNPNFLIYTIGTHACVYGLFVYFIRRWSKDWNKKIETGFFEEQLKTIKKSPEPIEKTPKLYVKSQWKKPNIYFSIPSIYLFISTGILVLGTIVKINDDYFLLSITYSLHLIILSIPSAIGAIQLWRRKKIGLIFSNVSLILLSLILPTSIFGIIQYHTVLDFLSGETGVIFGSSIGLSVVMMWFLSKAKKQVLWNESFSENVVTDETK